ncbi:MAG: uncharacterized protein PWQ20_137 [Thermotogaceae bacterium]|nr:uncharacterized protein [Thermotogaceae bacterium]
MKEFWTKRMKCPLCSVQFEQVKVFNEVVRVESYDTDLKPNFAGINPFFYSLTTCNSCYYTAFEDDFDSIISRINSNQLSKLKKVLGIARKRFNINLSENRDIDDAIKIHSLAILTYAIADVKSKLAEIYLRLAWLYRDKGEKEKEAVALTKALVNLEEVFEKEKNIEAEDRIIYLIGEIYLRLGKIDKARQWFSKLLENRKFQDSKYFKMARDRLSLLRGAKK